MQHVFAQNYTFEARYLGTRGVHLYTQVKPEPSRSRGRAKPTPDVDEHPLGGRAGRSAVHSGRPQGASEHRPLFRIAGFTSPITEYTPQGYSRYHGLALQLNRRFYERVQHGGSYTWSHLIDNSTAEVFSTVLTPRRPQDFRNLAADQSSSALDRRHRFTLSLIYDVPWFRNGNKFMRTSSGTGKSLRSTPMRAPEYFTVQSGIDSNLNGDAWPDRMIVNPAGAAHTGSAVTADQPRRRDRAMDDRRRWRTSRRIRTRGTSRPVRSVRERRRNTEPTRPINNIDVTR